MRSRCCALMKFNAIASRLFSSRRVVPARATELGYRFRIDSLERALEAELR
jgi:NAD dependent epimerase/dehydratase family enzyme